MALTIGQTVGDYRVIGIIGTGGMGSVYKVQHLISDRIEAMKVVLPDLVESPELADRFIREIKVQARLSHPNIAALHNALRIDNQLLMIMEYVDGKTLHARLRESRLEAAESVDIALQILSALAYAHHQGVIHRDIKPANIILTPARQVKLMDFGIARSISDHHLTRTGAAVGSIYYMSPEQVQGVEVDGRADIYAIGILLYEMVTGVRPIVGESSWAVMNGHLTQIPRAPASVEPSLPEALSLAILKAIEKSPAERYQSASEFAELLYSIRVRIPSASRVTLRREPSSLTTYATEVATPSPPPLGGDYAAPLKSPAPPSTPVVATPSPTPGSGNSSASAPMRFDPDALDRLTRELAAYVGPMARVLVTRAAKKAQSWKQLHEALATEVPEGPERKKFLAKRLG